ncbi:MAG TPA: RsmE family RNA methyltransferase [Gemmatimonadales bacterium]
MDREALAALASLPGFLADAALPTAGDIVLGSDAAHHMRVRRVGVGQQVRVTDGVGRVARAAVVALGRASAVVAVEASHEVMALSPSVHLLAPVADRERMLWLAEKATELGVASWRAVGWRRSRSVSPRGEGEAFHQKVRARMASALIQSGGAWLPRVEPDVALERAGGLPPGGAVLVLLDAAGDPLLDVLDSVAPGAEGLWVAVGPEGGVEDGERASLVAAGFRLASIGGSVLRFETAGVAALAALRAWYDARGSTGAAGRS